MSIEIIDISNIHTHLITNETATFYVRFQGEGWEKDGIHNNDVLVIDKSIPLQHDQLIIAAWSGHPEMKLKRYVIKDNIEYLMDSQGKLEQIQSDSGFEVWGPVAYVIRSFRS